MENVNEHELFEIIGRMNIILLVGVTPLAFGFCYLAGGHFWMGMILIPVGLFSTKWIVDKVVTKDVIMGNRELRNKVYNSLAIADTIILIAIIISIGWG